MDAYIGLDVGTTHIKAVALDERYRVVAKGYRSTPLSGDKFGDVHNAHILLKVCQELVREVSDAIIAHYRVRAISVASVGEEGFFLDRFDKVLAESVVWYEHRSSDLASQWMAQYGGSMPRRTGLPCQLSYSLFKWFWFKEAHPDLWARIVSWLPISDFIAFHLSGEKAVSSSHATRTFAFDVYRNDWIAEGVEAALPEGERNLPPVVLSGQSLGVVGVRGATWGLPPETCVIVGGHDHPVGAIGAGVLDSETILDSMGTAELLYWPQETLPRWDDRPQGLEVGRTNFRVPYYFGAGTYTGMLVKTLTNLFNIAPETIETLLSRSSRSSLRLFPNKLGERIQFDLRRITPDSQSSDIIRAVIESSAMVIKSAFNMMQENSSSPNIPKFIVIGGGTNSVSSLRIKASVLDQPIYLTPGIESVATGGACLAKKAIDNLDFRRPEYQIIEPDRPLVDFYADQYADFIEEWQQLGMEASS